MSGLTILAVAAVGAAADDRAIVAERIGRLTRDTQWQLVQSLPIKFRTFHPQGMVKIGETFFVSSVEVRTRTRRLSPPQQGHDRDAGEGAGHLFKIDKAGNLVNDLALGEGAIYHPGGIDFDGTSVWVPVAEYRPDSRSIVYRVDPATMKAAEVFRFPDHLGAIVHDTSERRLHGVSWGSRRFYRWTLDAAGRVADPGTAARTPVLNRSHYVDYQDCKYLVAHRMLCGGTTELRAGSTRAPFHLGGIDLVDLEDGRPVHQVPLMLWTASGLDMTHNPLWIEPSARGLRAYFMPEDDASTLYVYEAQL